MSTTPRYADVRLAAERRREAKAAAEAARRRLAEAAKRRRDAELQRRRAKFERRQAEMIGRIEARQSQSRHSGSADSGPERRVTNSRRSPQASRRVARSQARGQRPPSDLPPIEEPQATVDLAAFEAATEAYAGAVTMLEAIGGIESLREVAGRLRVESERLNAEIDADDQSATVEVTGTTRALVNQASSMYEDFVEKSARNRIVAGSLAAALPERYAIGALTELPDGTISFHAHGPDDDLLVEVLDEGAGESRVTYRIDGMTYYGQVHAGPGEDDCPGLTLDLEESHWRAADDGLEIGPITWAGGRSNNSKVQRQDESARRHGSSS